MLLIAASETLLNFKGGLPCGAGAVEKKKLGKSSTGHMELVMLFSGSLSFVL